MQEANINKTHSHIRTPATILHVQYMYGMWLVDSHFSATEAAVLSTDYLMKLCMKVTSETYLALHEKKTFSLVNFVDKPG